MKINNPKVTLQDEARCSVKEEGRSGFLDWLFEFNVQGDDGELYALGGSILSLTLEKIDLVTLCLAKGTGTVRQLKNSIYKVTQFPGGMMNKFFYHPQGTLQIQKKEHSILVQCGKQYQLECFDDGTWHLILDTLDGEYQAEFWHKPYGYPLWYGRETPSYLTQHSITYGYNWAGDVEGTFTYKGKVVHVKGTGQRERYVAVDSSAAELGGWEDWGYITFNEMHSSMYDMRLGMKDFSLYDLQKQIHYPEGKMEITHEDWAFMKELDGFIPMNYHITIHVEGGCYDVHAHVGNARTWGVTYKVPDYPVGVLIFDHVEGTFTDITGTKRILTGGRGTMSVRQWHAYPNILPKELYMDQTTSEENRLDTL